MKYRMLVLAAVAVMAPNSASTQDTAQMRQACDMFRSIEDRVDVAQSHSSDLARRIRQNFRGDTQVSFQVFNSGPLRFDCTISMVYKYDSRLDGGRDSTLARLAELLAAREAFDGYVNSLKSGMKRQACDQSGYTVQDGPSGTMPIYEPGGIVNAEAFYNTQICTKVPWRDYFQ